MPEVVQGDLFLASPNPNADGGGFDDPVSIENRHGHARDVISLDQLLEQEIQFNGLRAWSHQQYDEGGEKLCVSGSHGDNPLGMNCAMGLLGLEPRREKPPSGF